MYDWRIVLDRIIRIVMENWFYIYYLVMVMYWDKFKIRKLRKVNEIWIDVGFINIDKIL